MTAETSSLAARAPEDPIATYFRKIMPLQRSDPDFISLAAGPPDNDLLPNELFPELVKAAADKYGNGLLNYNMPQGLPPLREAMAAMLTDHGVTCTPENMLITSGGMEAISLAAQLTLDEGDTVLVEEPGFPGALSTFQLPGAKLVSVACDNEGMVPEALEAAIEEHGPKLVSLMPDYQNPTGKVMSLGRRKQIAEIIKRHSVYAVEDGAYSQLRFAGEHLPSLQSLAPELVMYAYSVSKVFAPGMRVGALVAPAELVQKAGNIKSSYNMQASGINQAVTELFINPEHDYLGKQLEAIRVALLERRDAMVAALAEHFPEGSGFSWTKPDGGMFLWLVGPKDVDFEAILDKALEKKMAYIPGTAFYAPGSGRGRNEARLNFASTPAAKVREAIGRLAAAIKA